MAQSMVGLAKELTLALIQRGNVSPENMQATLQSTYETLATLKAQKESGTSPTNMVITSLTPARI
jgi:hypothetical protein